MCGLAGALSLDGRSVHREDVRAMTDALAHRGPDEGAVVMVGAEGPATRGLPLLGLGHRRLRVIDLTISTTSSEQFTIPKEAFHISSIVSPHFPISPPALALVLSISAVATAAAATPSGQGV